MRQPEYDAGKLEEKLIRVAAEVYGFDKLAADTPMSEIRAMAEQAGMMFGRIYAAALHVGPITSAMAMDIRASEQLGKERFLASADKLLRPGGELREILQTSGR